jgi:hypothetical protein
VKTLKEKYFEAIDRLDTAAQNFATKGGGHPADIPAIVKEYHGAKQDLRAMFYLLLNTRISPVRKP